jgi:hypothetical protein
MKQRIAHFLHASQVRRCLVPGAGRMMAAGSLASNPPALEPAKKREAARFRSRTDRGWNRTPATSVADATYLQGPECN